MKKQQILLITLVFFLMSISCSISKKNLSIKQQDKLDKIFCKYPDSKSLLLNNESIQIIDNTLIKPKKVKSVLIKLDTSNISEIRYFANFITAEKANSKIRYYLVHIKTDKQIPKNPDLKNGYEFLISEKEEWLKNNPNPVILINGRLFSFEDDYRPFLEELNAIDLLPIDILKENNAMAIYNCKSVLLLTTKYGQ
jgi:hypothetical protein